MSADSILGRPSIALMSDQTLMELLISNLKDADAFRDMHGDYLAIQEWTGVSFDNKGYVSAISWYRGTLFRAIFTDDEDEIYCKKGGSVDFRYIPHSVRYLDMGGLDLEGTIDTEILPRGLLSLEIMENILEGNFTLSSLPPAIQSISIQTNEFVGSLPLHELPSSVLEFNAHQNFFSGSIEIHRLPLSIRQLRLEKNDLHGDLDMRFIPDSLRLLDIRGCKFRQDILQVKGSVFCRMQFFYDQDVFAKIIDENGHKALPANERHMGFKKHF